MDGGHDLGPIAKPHLCGRRCCTESTGKGANAGQFSKRLQGEPTLIGGMVLSGDPTLLAWSGKMTRADLLDWLELAAYKFESIECVCVCVCVCVCACCV